MERVENKEIIDSVDKLTRSLNLEMLQGLKNRLVRDVMKNDLGMSYRKIRAISHFENTAVNLVLRQQFAMKFIEALLKKTRWFNIDETWLGMTDFRRMKWQDPRGANSTPKALMQPRISMIVALDNYGQTYVSLSQGNTDTSTIELFLRDLVSQVAEEDRRWRQNTIFFWDGAPYHQSREILEVLKTL